MNSIKIIKESLLIIVVSLLLFSCGSEDKKILRVWTTESDPNTKQVFEEIIKDFEDENPGVQVEYEAINWNALNEKLTTALAAGDVPDLTQLEPFQVYSLYSKGLLEPIDGVIEAIGENDIYSSVRDLQFYDNHYYGIAYAIGTTYFSYRKDWANEKGLNVPTNWADYINFVKSLTEDTNGDGIIDHYGAILPGGSPMFMDVLFAEMLRSNGGQMYDEKGKPTFTNKEVVETLRFIAEVSKYAPQDWTSEAYVDQFRTLATGKVSNVLVTFARAIKQIEKDAPIGINNPDHFAVMEQPVGPSGKISSSTIDCEPWVIFKSSKLKDQAKKFLLKFYQKDNYLKYCSQVPIHLTPILKSIAESPEYTNNPLISKWKSWQDNSIKMLNENRVKPKLIVKDSDLKLPFLMEMEGSRIISDMIISVAKDNVSPEDAALDANKKAEQLIEKLGYKKW